MDSFEMTSLKKLLREKGRVLRFIEAHSALSAMIAERAAVGTASFDGLWLSSFTISSAKACPDTEFVDRSARLQLINEIQDATNLPLIFDGDSGGDVDHLVRFAKTLERLRVSAIVIEDKCGPKRNSHSSSMKGTELVSIKEFTYKIDKVRSCLNRNSEMMLFARCEGLVVGKSISDTVARAMAYVDAGADGIMLHTASDSKTLLEECYKTFRSLAPNVPLMSVPTSVPSMREIDLRLWGVDIIIYANQLLRASVLAMQRAANAILENESARGDAFEAASMEAVLKLVEGN